MHVEFKTLRFKNLLSYGNSFTEFSFEKGLNVIKAPNGSGKSSILDALTFVLFGKPYRNIKLDELINWTNEKNLVVEVEFYINNVKYKIIRGLKPSLFEIYKNDTQIDLLSTKKLNQEEIDKLLGINLRLFKNIVSVAVTNNKPFLEMSIGEKRTLMSNIFNIDIIDEMSKEIKKQKTVDVNSHELRTTELNGIINNIEANNKCIADMKTYIESFNSIKHQAIDTVQGRINNILNRIEKSQKNIKLANDKINAIKAELIVPDDNDYRSITKNIGFNESEKTKIENTLNQIKNNAVCPICNSKLDNKHIKQHTNNLLTELSTIIEKKIPELKTQEQEWLSIKEEFNKQTDFISVIERKKSNEENLISSLEQDLVTEKNQLEVEKNKECPVLMDSYTIRAQELDEQLKLVETTLSELEESIQINTELIKIFGDDGMKKFFFTKLVALLNQNINEFLRKFEMNINLTFDENLNETIVLNHNNKVTSYGNYSGGERSRIDMSILLSFFNVSRIISNWSCNVMLIDELIDNGVDQDGIEQFISTLYNIVTENEKQLGIYIVSHKLGDIKVQVSNIIEIKKIGLFSEIEVK